MLTLGAHNAHAPGTRARFNNAAHRSDVIRICGNYPVR
jgi:hypothetical protein